MIYILAMQHPLLRATIFIGGIVVGMLIFSGIDRFHNK